MRFASSRVLVRIGLLVLLCFSCEGQEAVEPRSEEGGDMASDAGGWVAPVVPDLSDAYVEPDVSEGQPFFELGTNITGVSVPGSFSPLSPGDDLFVELGFQGSYMVVLAFRTQGYHDGEKVNLLVSLSVDGMERAKLKYNKKKLLAGGDDLDYFYNIFLVTEDYLEYVDQEGTVSIELLTLDDELLHELSVPVLIRAPGDA